MEKIIGFKGFDKDLKCKNFQYKVGDTFEITENPKLCQRGFHFSRTLMQAMIHYPNTKGNRFCEVHGLGDIEHDETKVVTNKLLVVKELSTDEICATLEGINLAILKEATANGGIVCGSLALKLQGFDLGRPIKDIDFIFPNSGLIDSVFRGYSIASTGSWIIENKSVKGRRAFFDKDYGLTYDVFIKDDTFREVDYYGIKIKVADPLKIWKEKLLYAFGGNQKHAKDFAKFAHRLSFSLNIKDSATSQELNF